MKGKIAHSTGLEPALAETLEPRLLLSAVNESLDVDYLATSQATPPDGYAYDAAQEASGGAGGTSVLLSDVPEYFWYRGCGPTSVAMVLGYWDTLGYPNYFVGDAATQTADVNAGIASAGHDADWVPTPDSAGPYHSDDSIADFFKTSRDPLPFGWSYLSDADDAFDDYANFVGYPYANSWNESWGSLTWSDLTGEINAGRPMMFLVDSSGNGSTDHFIPIIGYRTDPSNQYAAYTTWSNDPGVHWFDWKGMTNGDAWGVAAGTFFRPSAGIADLVTSGTAIWPPSLTWGKNFTYFYSMDNYGDVAAGGSTIRFYMSTNSTISSADYELGSLYVSSMAAAGHLGGGVSLSLPATPPSGFTATDDVYIGMIVDADNTVAESVGGNNSNRGEGIDYKAVHISSQPDLIGTEFDLNINVMNLGSVQADFTVENVGDTAAGGFYVRFYLSSNTTISTGDTYLGQWYIASLAGGASYSNTITLSPGTADPFGGDGTYTIGMVVDYSNAVTEGVETNNSNRGFGLDKAEANYGTRIFNADFEHGDGAMDIINTTAWAPEDGLWHMTTTRGGDSGHSGTHSLHYGRYDKVNAEWDYDIGDSAGVFYSKRIELPNEPAALSFNYFSEVESSSSGDDIRVQIYDPETGVYSTLLSKGNGIVNNTSGAWVQATTSLAAFAGKNVRLRFVFDTLDAIANNYEGWYVDDIAIWAVDNPTTVEGFRSLNYASDYYHEASYMHWEADHDTFVFNEEQSGGTFSITSVHGSSSVNPAIAVYDYVTGEMLYMDSDSGSGDEASISLVNSGYWNSYLVEVWDEEEDSTGEVDVMINGTGTFSNTLISVDKAGIGSYNGYIDNDEDTDYFRVVAPPQASGDLDISLVETSGDVRTRLQVWRGMADAAPEVIASTENGAETAHFTNVQPGEVFYISASDHDFNGTGGFRIDVDFSMAVPETMTTAEGYAYFHGDGGISNDTQSFGAYISVGDTDSYIFAGDTGWTGNYTVTVNRLTGDIDPVVAVYDPVTGEQLAFNRDYGDDSAAQLTVSLTSLKQYIVAVADATGSGAGDVELIIQAPSSYSGQTISLDVNGDGSLTGGSITTNDTDFYILNAPADTDGTLEIVVTPDTSLDAAIALFDASGDEIAHAFYTAAGAAETISVSGLTPGATYYLSVLAESYATTGSFAIDVNFGQVVPETFPGDYSYWTIPSLHGDWSANFGVSSADDWVGWLFASDYSDANAVFSVTGYGGLAPALGLYDYETGERIAFDANTGDSATASFTASISNYTRYYLVATGRDGATGTVNMSMNLVEMYGATVPIDVNGHGSRTDYMNAAEDIDYFAFTAPALAVYGDLTIWLHNLAGGIRGSLSLWDDTTGHWLNSAGNSTAGADVTLTYGGLLPGHTYVVAVTNMVFSGGTGSFTLDIDMDIRLPGDANLDKTVDIQDFVILKQNYGTGSTWGQGDFNEDGAVDIQDFVILKQNYGASLSGLPDSLATLDALAAASTASAATQAPAAPSSPDLVSGLGWDSPLEALAVEEVLDIIPAL